MMDTAHTLVRNARARAAFITAVAFCFAAISYVAYRRALVPHEINYSEGLVLSAAVRVLGGNTPYPEPASFPYTFNLFGPVGYLLTAAAIKVFGLSLLGPRLVVLLAGAGAALVIAGLTRRLGGRWQFGFIMGVLFLSTPLALLWYPLLRVDYWAILFSLLGLLAFLTFRRMWFVALIFFAFAVLTKITAVAAPLACVAELVLRRQFRRALMVLAATAGVLLTCLLFTEGALAHLFRTNPEPYSIGRALDLYGYGLSSCLLPVGVIVYAVAVGSRWTPANRLGWLYLAACSATAFSAGNTGADTNHLLEWSAAVCLVAGLALGGLLERCDPLVSLLVLAFTLTTAFWTWQMAHSPIHTQDRSGCAEAYAYIRSFPGHRILSEDTTALILARKPVLVSDAYMMTQLGASVKWSQGSMEQLAARNFFDLIVLGGEIDAYKPESGRWPPALLEVIQRNYRLVRRLDCPPCIGAAYVPRAPAYAER